MTAKCLTKGSELLLYIIFKRKRGHTSCKWPSGEFVINLKNIVQLTDVDVFHIFKKNNKAFSFKTENKTSVSVDKFMYSCHVNLIQQ